MKRTVKRILVAFVVVAMLVCCLSSCGLFMKKAERTAEHGFIVDGEKYIGISIGYTGEGRTIAKADGFDVMEIPEDKDHNFLAVRSFLDNWTIVKESYVIPTDGEVTVAYLGYYKRVTKGVEWDMIQSILNEDFAGEFVIKGKELYEDSYMTDVDNATQYIFVGYEGCPVGTDMIGTFGNINGKTVFIKAEDFSIKEFDLKYTCYILKDEYQELFKNEHSTDFEVITEQ